MAEKCSICGKSGMLMGGYTCQVCGRRICKAHSELTSGQTTINKDVAAYLISTNPSSIRGQNVARITNNGSFAMGAICCPECLSWLNTPPRGP